MEKISAVIITFNEENNINRCLVSLLKVADEIIIVDSFSTDQTKVIALAHPVKFIENPFQGHIEQKNFALQHASNAWILSLDADECLSEELINEILILKNNGMKDHAYCFKRLTNYCGKWIKHSGWYPDIKTRLFHRKMAEWGGENPHDKLILKNPTPAKQLKGDLLHYSFYTISDHVLQIEKFTNIAARESFKKGKKSSILKIILAPQFKFFRDYIFKLGFLDGYYGFIICYLSAVATFLKYVKLRQLNTKSI